MDHPLTKRSSVPVLSTGARRRAAPRQARSVESRRRLLAAGRRRFARQGYDATSIAQITADAGVAAGAFYIYFSSKREFLITLMNDFLGRLAAVDLRPAPAVSVQTRLRRLLAGVFKADVEYSGVVRAWQEATLSDAALARMRHTIESWTAARILRVFRRLQQHPDARGHRNLRPFARMMDRHFWSLLARGARLRRADVDREVNAAADVIYHYLFRDPRTKRAPRP